MPTRDALDAAARRFVGRIEQRPPSFSALKIHGRPAYKLARRGKPVELSPRPIDIYRIEVKAFDYPELVLEIDCGGGTYVRSLGRDLAESLGTAAVMSALRRTSIGDFHIDQSVCLEDLTRDRWQGFVQPPLRAVEYLPQVRLSAQDTARIRNGLTIEIAGDGRLTGGGGHLIGRAIRRGDVDDNQSPTSDPAEVVALDPAGQLIGILTPLGSGRWRTLRNLPISADSLTQHMFPP